MMGQENNDDSLCRNRLRVSFKDYASLYFLVTMIIDFHSHGSLPTPVNF